VSAGTRVETLVDIDPGFHRTGVGVEEGRRLYATLASTEGLIPGGIHCYDGHNNQRDPAERREAAVLCHGLLQGLKSALTSEGLPVPRVVVCGTPTFTAYARMPDVELSPGTCVLHDGAYSEAFPDLPFIPAALLLTRVISVSSRRDTFTLDLGFKGLSADPPGVRGTIVDRPAGYAKPLFQSEEHWVFHVEHGGLPRIGDAMYVLPTHICPTVALYQEAHVIGTGGRLQGTWEIAARARRLGI
jgi:D-serine deaminase-like pyridoxal phosphate-dependent protein